MSYKGQFPCFIHHLLLYSRINWFIFHILRNVLSCHLISFLLRLLFCFTPFLTNYTIKRRFLHGIFEIRFWFEWFHIIPFYQPDFLQPSQEIPSLGNHALQRVPLEHLYNIYQLQLMYYQFHLEQ